MILSLGGNCFIKKYLNYIGVNQETNFFDYIGSSMWSINELFENDFSNLFNLDEYENFEIKKNVKLVTNKRYYLIFKHDFSKKYSIKSLFLKFTEKYTRRINRLKDLLLNEKKIIFIRLEESLIDRIIYKEYEDKFKKSEFDYLKDFINIIKNKYPNLDFEIIYISSQENDIKENNIKIINLNNEILDWNNCAIKINNLFLSNNI